MTTVEQAAEALDRAADEAAKDRPYCVIRMHPVIHNWVRAVYGPMTHDEAYSLVANLAHTEREEGELFAEEMLDEREARKVLA